VPAGPATTLRRPHVAGSRLGAQLLERRGEQARSLALRDLETPRDLRLRQVVREAQANELLLSRWERRDELLNQLAILARRELVVRIGARPPLEGRQRHRERGAGERDPRVVHGHPRGRSGLVQRGLVPELLRDELRRVPKRRRALLLASRYADHRRTVAQVTAQLAVDRRPRVRGERDAACRIEAARRSDETDRADLHELVERLSRARVPSRERPHERKVALDEISDGIRSAIHSSMMLPPNEKLKLFPEPCIDGLLDGYFRDEAHRGGGRIRPVVRRTGGTGLAVTALALGFAMPAHADDIAAPVAPTVPDTTVVGPAASAVDPTAGAAAPTSAATTQGGAANVAISVRIDSPGDNGAVSQTIAAIAGAANQAAQAATGGQASASTDQGSPANLNISVRVGSAGSDGSATQAVSASSDATAAAPQYQAPAPEYQPQAPAAQPAPDPSPSISSAPAPSTTSESAPAASSLPSSWTWNWTWTCGDTTGPGTAQPINTGMAGWNWTWNLDGVCAGGAPSTPKIDPVIPPESPALILVPPELPESPAAPTLPANLPVRLPPPVEAVIATVIGSADVPLAPSLFAPATEIQTPRSHSPPPPATGRVEPLFSGRSAIVAEPAAALAATVAAQDRATSPVRSSAAPPERRAEQPAELGFTFPLPGGGAPSSGGAGGGSSGGSGSGGVAAALALWMLLGLPGLAVLRLPAGRRAPRSHIDDTRDRPG